MVIAAILGGGKGARMGAGLPKQFIELAGEAVIVRSCRTFLKSGLTDGVLVLVPEDYVPYTVKLLEAAGLTDADVPVAVEPGGASRGETLLRALTYVKDSYGLADSILVTHDAARPFVTEKMIEDNIAGARAYGAVNTCIPATDTVFLSADGRFINEVPPRKTVFHAQTPQSFRAGELYELCTALDREEFLAMTDGCSVFTRFGRPVFMVPGSEDNIKITYPGDLDRARQILNASGG